jgi:hypothetical protein
LEFLSKMPNPGILESWIWGEAEFEEILFFPEHFIYLCSLNSNPSYKLYGLGSILNCTKIIKSKLFNFIENQVTITTSGEKWRS